MTAQLTRSKHKSGPPPCPSGKRFDTQEAAEKAKPGAQVRECGCGSWHGTRPLSGTGKAAARTPARRDTGFSPAVKLAVRKRAGNGDPEQARCEACAVWLGRYGGQVQHRLARRSGGSCDPEVSSVANAALLCGTPFTGDHGRAERREREMGPDAGGFWLRTGQHPAEVPVLLAGADGGIKVWLTTAGGYSTSAPVVAS